MSRTFCLSCQRPEAACICRFTTAITNQFHVVVLQHPSEVKQTKGTIALLAKSLSECQVIIGEDFSNNAEVKEVFKQFQPLLLYPGDDAQILDEQFVKRYTLGFDATGKKIANSQLTTKPLCLLILDGTWKKAYRMFMTSTNLHKIPQVCLPEYLANSGQYHIRKVAKQNALSSLEAACYALALLEAEGDSSIVTTKQAGNYQSLLNKFNDFNQFQLSFRPKEHLDKSRNQNDL